MTPDDLYRLRFVADAQISPAGDRVAYVVQWADPDDHTRYRSQIGLVGADGASAPRPLTSGKHRDWAPRWSPDGRWLAFLSNREGERPQLLILPLDGGEPRQATALKHGAGTPVWSPDGTRLAFAAGVDIPGLAEQEGQPDDLGKSPRVRLVTRVEYKSDGSGFGEAQRQHVFVVAADGSAEPRQVTDGDWDDRAPAWSPDGASLVFVANRERDRDLSSLSDLWVVPARGGRARRLTRHRGLADAPAWSPDGRWIAYLGHERGWTYGAPTELLVVPAAGGEPTSLSAAAGLEVGNVALTDTRNPFAATPPRWLPDSRALLAPVSAEGRVSLARFDLADASVRVTVGGDREIAACTLSADGQRVAFCASDPTHPYEVSVADLDGAVERRLTEENCALLAEIALVAPEPFAVTSTDGETVHGWLMRPPALKERGRAPLILEVHGGPEAMYAWTLMHEFQVLAGRGYGVLYVNPRGSKGYGEAFTARIFADWGAQDAADCLAAVDAAATLPWVDADRLGVTGGSYGGFMTAWLVGHDQRFRAAVAQRGVYNMVSFYGTSDIGPTFGDYIFGTPVYEREDLYRRCSPLSYVQSMRTPLLIIHSEMDLRCPIEQAEQLFVQLRRIGKVETELVRFPDESHNLSRSGRPDRRVERLERIAAWFDRFLS